MDRPSKRLRLAVDADEVSSGSTTPLSLTHPISPPREGSSAAKEAPIHSTEPALPTGKNTFKSPFELTKIRDLPPEANVETLTLKAILGHPLIAECWEFNYLHDLDFLLEAFDEDVRKLVQVHVVHGFWKREDPSRLNLVEQAAQHENVILHAAFMPEMFGTHHTKMMVLLRHDDMAQVVITTANMIPRDWANLTQGVWRTSWLPLLRDGQPQTHDAPTTGSGQKFKLDLLNYLRAYDAKRVTCEPLVNKLVKFDFSSVRGALIASVPGRHVLDDFPTRWGWAAMKQNLREVPTQGGKAEIVVQVSSIATLGPTNTWLRQSLFKALSGGKGSNTSSPDFKVVFPTPDEIRRSLDGYGSGASIHTKIQSPQQQKQLQYLKPIFCHWANDAPDGAKRGEGVAVSEAGRKRAAPHIKTYIRNGEKGIDWALLTSANLSKQAWGEAVNGLGEVRIASWEIGVLVWPALYGEGATMKATFHTNALSSNGTSEDTPVVGLRVPYDLPLQPYGSGEKPWVASASYNEPDWKGALW